MCSMYAMCARGTILISNWPGHVCVKQIIENNYKYNELSVSDY